MKMIDDIRRENMAKLVEEFDSVTALSARLERSESQVSQWLNGSIHSETGKRRGMRADTARYIESKCGKKPGWLDIDHSVSQSSTVVALTVAMFALPCPKCGKVAHKSFIELELADSIACASCGNLTAVDDYYGQSELETILKSLGGSGLTLRKRNKLK